MAQDYAVKPHVRSYSTLGISLMGMLSAISIVLILTVRIPLMPAAAWLEYDMVDIPILLGSFILGPWAGMLILTVVSLIQAFMLGGSGIYGFIMHMVSSGCFILLATYLYRKLGDNNKSLVISIVSGALAMALVMIPLNLLITPLYSGIPFAGVLELILPVLLPFNLIKSACNGVIFFLLYKSLRVVLQKYRREERRA